MSSVWSKKLPLVFSQEKLFLSIFDEHKFEIVRRYFLMSKSYNNLIIYFLKISEL